MPPTPTATATPAGGLRGEYYNDPQQNEQFGTLALVRYDAPIDSVWGEGSPGDEVQSDHFSVKWTGRLKALSGISGTGTYQLQTVSDEGVRLWLGGQLLIDNWTAHTVSTDTVQVQLQGGSEYDIRVEYYEVSGSATMQLEWITPGPFVTGAVAIPKGQLLSPVSAPPENPPDVPETNNVLLYLHTDHLGSVVATTRGDNTHAVVSSQQFDPWGRVRTPSGTPTPGPAPIGQTKLNYTGQKLDGTGLLYYHARMYDPAMGRFVSPDSIVPASAGGAEPVWVSLFP